MTHIIRTISELRSVLHTERSHHKTIGFVPTMGALHEGHGALMTEARQNNDCVVVSIFVNPKQFAPHEDLDQYPRPIESDIAFLKKHHVNYLFLPSPDEIYPQGFATTISIKGSITQDLEATYRPHFFDGVATIVTKLLIAVSPDTAYFGEKDYQQLCVIQQMTMDLGLPTKIQSVPTIREASGLALSSRNRYLSSDQLKIAQKLNVILQDIAQNIGHGQSITSAINAGKDHLMEAGFTKIDYVSLRDSQTLSEISEPQPKTIEGRLLAAAYIDHIRLIDNIAVRF